MKNLVILFIVFGVLNAFSLEKTPNVDPLQTLELGNKRFLAGKSTHLHETQLRIRELKNGQHPNVIVVSCSDSRVPPELVFDQGLGDIFSIRTAGQVIGDLELGSIEYAVEHLHSSLIVVMGHRDCGAIKAFIESKGTHNHLNHINSILKYIENESEEKKLISDNGLVLDKAIEANIRHGVRMLKSSRPVLSQLYYTNKLKIVGALYDIESGKVVFYE